MDYLHAKKRMNHRQDAKNAKELKDVFRELLHSMRLGGGLLFLTYRP
jgi:hypothetical protein